MRKSVVILVVLIGLHAAAIAQEFKPFPTAKITVEQWESYLATVKAKFHATEKAFPEQLLTVFTDSATHTQYAFTTKGHPAHPAWITRQIVNVTGDVNIRQTGFFAGSEVAFAELFRAYLELNTRMRQQLLQQRTPPGAP